MLHRPICGKIHSDAKKGWRGWKGSGISSYCRLSKWSIRTSAINKSYKDYSDPLKQRGNGRPHTPSATWKKKLREFKRKSLIHNTLNHPSNCPDPPSSNDHLFWSLQSSLNFTSMNGKKTICYNCLHRNDICSRVILFTNRLQNVVNQSGV